MKTRRRCDQCEAAVINGIYCHETGCPNAWREPRECRECGCEFAPDRRGQVDCEDCERDRTDPPQWATDAQAEDQ